MGECGSRVLVLGGARSGKSAQAEALLAAESEVDYVAFAQPEVEDAEWAERIARQREHRPEHWRAFEVTDARDIGHVLAADCGAVLVDSATA